MLGACGYPGLPHLSGGDDAPGSGDASGGGDARFDDAPPGVLSISSSSSSFDLHATDTRDTVLTITNNTMQSGTPALQVTGLTLGTMTFTSNTCTTGLAPGMACTATGHLTATAAGQVNFQVTASSAPLGTAMAALSVNVRPACATTCGPNGMTNCCASAVVPGNAPGATLAGALFYRGYDVGTDGRFSSMASPATVSDVRIDTYEVTVGRFRAFVNDNNHGTQTNPPASGAGSRTLNGMAAQGGWDPSFNASLAADKAALVAAVKCDATHQTWTDFAGANESLPMNCVTWYEAMAFCAWDGGFVPTEAEWNYAAAGGSEQRAYPWANPASSLAVDCSYANYAIDVPAGTLCVNGTNRVGSESPKGDSKWGQSDLGGNVDDWMLDYFDGSYPTPCNDCANLTPSSNFTYRGGSWYDSESGVVERLRPSTRTFGAGSSRSATVGMRCARKP